MLLGAVTLLLMITLLLGFLAMSETGWFVICLPSKVLPTALVTTGVPIGLCAL